MKKIYRSLKATGFFSFLAFFSFLFSSPASAQTMAPGQAAKFGIDGDTRSDERQNGNFTAAGSHDWFKTTNGQGAGLIDVADAANWKSQLMNGANVSFTKKMQFQRYSIQDGVLMMDATYARDYINNDKTAFKGNNTKATTAPTEWGTSPNGSNVSDKTDIVDSYVSLRRDGTAINGNLIATMALATLATNGDHYADFEFYKEAIAYNTATGKFSNSGPSAYGSHSLWSFNADGSINSWGDMSIGFSFNNSTVTDVKILIWVSKTVYNTVDPKNFDFIANEFYESVSVNGYGYAAIKPNGTKQLIAWGTVNSASTAAPAWGTNSKDLGANSNGYFSADYSAGQLAEAAVDLTSLGIDPIAFSGTEACDAPFKRLLIKSRSASSFSSALSDFAGPYEIMDGATLPASIASTAHLTCAVSSVRLAASGFVTGGSYNWTTADGNIAKMDSDNAAIDISKAGTYYLQTSVAAGCATHALDSVLVTVDDFKPVATAAASAGMMASGQSITLMGGNPAASDYTTPFGGSAGLVWQWDGINGTQFSSALQNPVVTEAGTYRLVLTESRNGCSDTAFVSVKAAITLPVTFTGFTATADKQQQSNLLSWKIANAADASQFLVEKSTDGVTFSTVGYVFADEAHTAYSFSDKKTDQTAYYRIKAVQKSGAAVRSAIIKLDGNSALSSLSAYADGAGVITLRYNGTVSEKLAIKIVNMNGQVVRQTERSVAAGANAIRLTELAKPNAGVYVVVVTGEGGTKSAKISW